MDISSRMRDLNKDIVIEILSWVPANSLLRWRSVCKYWFALIKKPSFIQKHLHHSMISHDTSVLISSPYSRGFDVQCYLNYTTGSFSNPKQIFSHPFKPYRPSMDQITSVNGLLFCHRYDQKRYCIWNPCTKEYKLLPEPPFIKFDKHQERLVSQYGFGYDQTINDYKVVVRNVYKGNCLPSEVQVYTLGTNSWRNITPIIPKELRTRLPCGVFMNGAVHWLDISGKKIISFDIEKENFKEILIKQPKCSHGRWIHTMELQAFKGSLCCHVELTIDDPAKTCLEMWMMSDCKVNNNESSWTKLFGTLLYDYYWLKLILTTTNGEIIMLNRVKDLVLSDPETQTIRTHGRICETLECQDRRRLEAAVYIESLVSLNSGTYYASPDG